MDTIDAIESAIPPQPIVNGHSEESPENLVITAPSEAMATTSSSPICSFITQLIPNDQTTVTSPQKQLQIVKSEDESNEPMDVDQNGLPPYEFEKISQTSIRWPIKRKEIETIDISSDDEPIAGPSNVPHLSPTRMLPQPAANHTGASKTKCTLSQVIEERNHSQVIYGVAFNVFTDPGEPDMFVTCGDYVITLYVYYSRTEQFEKLYSFVNENREEVYYSCAWSYSYKLERLCILAAGKCGSIRMMDANERTVLDTNMRHGGKEITDLKVWRSRPHFLLSAGYDLAIHLWNLDTGVHVAKFAGVGGHEDYVCSVDIHPSMNFFASAGNDRFVMVWSMNTARMQYAIEQSDDQSRSRPLSTLKVMFPVFYSNEIHGHVVDCIWWIKDVLISRSCGQFSHEEEGEIVIWKPGRWFHTKLTDLKYKFNTKKHKNKNYAEHPKVKKEDEEEEAKEPEADDSSSVDSNDSDYYGDFHVKEMLGVPNYQIICRFQVRNYTRWFMRFGMTRKRDLLAVGNGSGDIYLYRTEDLKEFNKRKAEWEIFNPKYKRIETPRPKKTIWQIAFNEAGTRMVAVTDGCRVLVHDVEAV